jgi:hypothetical protein
LRTGGGSTADYMRVPAGKTTIAIIVPDTSTNTSAFLVEDSLTRPDSGFVKFKFVNLIPDLTAGLDLYIGTVKVATAAYKEVSQSFILPTNNVSTTWAIRPAGAASTSAALISYTNAASLSNQRVFTVIARGYNSITTTSYLRRRQISLIYNQ